jgi:glucose-1-phosphate adenylyltransferase
VVGDGVIISDSWVHHSVLGSRAFIDEGCRIDDTIVMGSDFYETEEQRAANRKSGRPHLGVGKNCRLAGAIVDKNARIGDGCVLVAAGKADGTYANGLVIIRDGVLVVPKNAVLPPGTVV